MPKKESGTVNIRGRDYQTVAYRIQQFREKHPDWTLVTNIVARDPDCVVIQATISDEAGRVRATGHAEEFRKASQINRTSALENCETSAIGRCLAAYGMGGTEFASAEEVANAIHQQGKSGIHKPTDGAIDALEEDRQKHIVDLADGVREAFETEDVPRAYQLCETLTDADEKVALWSLLDSKQRAAIKGHATALKALMKGKEDTHASQA